MSKVAKAFEDVVTVPEIKQGNEEAIDKLVTAVLGKSKLSKVKETNATNAFAMLDAYETSLRADAKDGGETKGKRTHYQAPPNTGREAGHNIRFVLSALATKEGISKKEIAAGLSISEKAAQSLVQDCRTKGSLIDSEAGRWFFTQENEVTVKNYKEFKKNKEKELAASKE